MKILILGSGVIGSTLAYVLTKRGHEVIVLDRQEGGARECSFSNGGQLSYSHVDPWACPEVLPKVIRWLGKKDAPLIFRMRFDPTMWRWALQFLRYCTPAQSRNGILTMLRLAHYSQQCMDTIVKDANISFDYKQTGILRLFASEKELQEGVKAARFQQPFGYPFEVLTQQEAIKKEPALATGAASFAGAVYYPQDATGDAYGFSVGLLERCAHESNHTVFHYQTDIQGFETEGDAISGIVTNKGIFKADAYVMALGADSPLLLKKIGVSMPIYPLKGYSVSIPILNDSHAPSVSVTDMGRKIVCTRLGDVLRVAGTAELTGYDTTHTDYRIVPLLRQVRELFPDAGDFSQATHWACLRPSTPDGIPILGNSPYKNLYLNTGHGSLGWTLAAGSAYVLADTIEGKSAEIDLAGLTLERF